jgi:hypothetical protein
MNFNLFLWIREGVKQSILLGVSDAIDTIGMPENSESISPRLMEFMRQGSTDDASKPLGESTKRKRLGRSLKDLEPATEA